MASKTLTMTMTLEWDGDERDGLARLERIQDEYLAQLGDADLSIVRFRQHFDTI